MSSTKLQDKKSKRFIYNNISLDYIFTILLKLLRCEGVFRKLTLIFLVFLMCLFSVSAYNITQDADRLNYWDAENHTVTITNNCDDSLINITIPSGFIFVSGTGCSNDSSLIQCNVSTTADYEVQSPGSSATEYTVSTFPISGVNNSCTINNVSFITIKDYELFHTLVEYGRGRGNYFFDTFSSGYAGSGHTGTGCSYLPNGTMFELNFLHKINNIKQYFGDLTADAYNATFSCTYPNSSIVRQHLTTAIITNSTGAFTSYEISKIEGSWERMGYLGMDFNVGEYQTGQNFTINCTNMTYLFPSAGGSFVVDEDSFTLQIRDREPFTATASTVETIGNGTQEVLITYNITNNEVYTVDDVIIEIQAPPYATFIGTRGELWGTALDQYRIEKAQLRAGESEVIKLIARFDTSNAPGMSSISLTNGIKLKYVTCWELNAYNPSEYTQVLSGIGTGTVSMGTPADIVSVINRLNVILNISGTINTTVTNINTTVNGIESIVDAINTTTNDTNAIVKDINNTANSILTDTQTILSNTNTILSDTAIIIDQLNCNTTNDSPICDKVRVLNQTVQELWNLTLLVNYTAGNLNITIIENINTSGVNITVNVDLTNLTNLLLDVKTYINCTNATDQVNISVCNRLKRIENYTDIINNTLESLLSTTTYFNTTVFGNLTFQEILDAIDNVSVDTSEVLSALQELREFDEELVFLITDSFGLQQSAKDDFLKGGVVSAADKLSEANDRLRKTMDLIVLEKDRLLVQREVAEPEEIPAKKTNQRLIALIAALAIILVIYLVLGKSPPKKQEEAQAGEETQLGVLKLLPLFVFLLLSVSFASAGVITQFADALNFENSTKSMIVTVDNDCSGDRGFNVTVPAGSGFTIDFTSGACSRPSAIKTVCDFSTPGTGTYTLSNPAAVTITDHTVYEFPSFLNDTTDCDVESNVSFIKIPDNEIFYTLVEYGRGRGNYFYSTLGKAGSGHTGTSCPYIPNGTMFELNFLHKIFNIKQYFNDPDLMAENATFTCSYPNRTIVRTHLGNSIVQSSVDTNITYFIDQIEGSWERMGYVGMQFDSGEQWVGENLTIACSDIKYSLFNASGNITVFINGTSFNLQVRNPRPFIASASTTSTVGNGTQEVIITYNITNNEVYTVDDVVIEIEAPPYAEFIGTRGELWGTALDQYRIEKMYLAPNTSEIIQLVARFNTTNAPDVSEINLTQGIKLKYLTCWNLNAYNPAESVQRIYNIGTATLSMSTPSSVIGVRERIEEIYSFINIINITTKGIESTVTNIESVVSIINSTTINTNTIVKQINTTVNNILSNVTEALDNTNVIINDTIIIKDLINCNGTQDTSLCTELDDINFTANNISTLLYTINDSLTNVTVNVTVDLSGENISVNATPDLTNITIIVNDIKRELNCSINMTTEPEESICKRLIRIENTAIFINSTTEEINDLIDYFNITVFGNVTLQQLYDAITNITLDTSELLTEIRRMKEFDEELVFLVTDSFGLQQSAINELDNGNIEQAAGKLKEANDRLNKAAYRLIQIQEQEVEAIKRKPEKEEGSTLIIALLLVLVCMIVVIYLISKPPKNKEKQQMIEDIKNIEEPKPGS